jgi:hypothetical protein
MSSSSFLFLYGFALTLSSVKTQFADSYPFPSTADCLAAPFAEAQRLPEQQPPAELVSTFDLYHRGVPLLSHVMETSASSSWFLTSSFRVGAVECKSPAPVGTTTTAAPVKLELSWVVVDRRAGRAVNVSSRQPVAVDRHR